MAIGILNSIIQGIIMYDKNRNQVDQREMLQVKVNALAQEARIIRAAEKKALKRYGFCDLYCALKRHRDHDLRIEARHSTLALGMIRGRTIKQMEPKNRKDTPKPDMDKINAMLKKFGPAKVPVKQAA